jgi:hypothetical protein
MASCLQEVLNSSWLLMAKNSDYVNVSGSETEIQSLEESRLPEEGL